MCSFYARNVTARYEEIYEIACKLSRHQKHRREYAVIEGIFSRCLLGMKNT